MNESKKNTPAAVSPSNFIRHIIETDLAKDSFALRPWAGTPGPAHWHRHASLDTAKIRTRFPPEPNGYLHFGHAKSIHLNFGLAALYQGACHMRFDDTNPEKEEQEYVDAIQSAVRWLGFDWDKNLYFASDYFDFMYEAAEYLIQAGFAYVDEQNADEMRQNRGTLTEAGKPSVWRDRPVNDSLLRLREMRQGLHEEGSMVLRAKIDMASPNINLRDPAIYRIRKAEHHRTQNRWCIYPMYTYAHPIEDALERITHSICTLEFEDQRPFYDWLLNRLAEGGLLDLPLPQQIEFARLNLTFTVLSKRKLIQLVNEHHVDGWDDPRLPSLVGARRRGFSAEGFRLFAERIGVSKSDSWIEFSVLEDCMREHLNEVAPRRIAVLDPIKLVIDNYPLDQEEECFAPNHPQNPLLGVRMVPLSRELWIEREDFMETPTKGFFRLFVGNQVRLRYGYVVKCVSFEKDSEGHVNLIHCEYLPNTKSGNPNAEPVKVKGNIHWVSCKKARDVTVHLYDRLFSVAHPGEGGRDFLEDLNPASKKTLIAQVEPALIEAQCEQVFQFERHGYFVADLRHSQPGMPQFNRTVTLRDSWKK